MPPKLDARGEIVKIGPIDPRPVDPSEEALVAALRAELLLLGAPIPPSAKAVQSGAERARAQRDRILAEGIGPPAERGLSTLAIAMRLGVTWETVRRIAASHGIPIRRRAARSPRLRARII